MKTTLLTASAALILAGGPAFAQASAPAAPAAAAAATPAAGVDVIAAAKADGQFQKFAQVVEASGLGPTLSAGGPYTVFAPTDAAFAKLPAGELDTLLKPENKEKLVALVKNHVVDGQAKAEYFTGQTGQMTSIGGGALVLDGKNGVKIAGATVVKADIAASNGVIHAIDNVLVPAADQQASLQAPAPAAQP